MTTALPPPGFEAWRHPSPVLDALGPFASHGTDPLRSGFAVTANKLNGRGLLHAGVIATFADVAIGHGLSALAGPDGRYVTIGLSCQLLGAASDGDWIEVTVTAHKDRGRVVAGSAEFQRGERIIATAHALFVPASVGTRAPDPDDLVDRGLRLAADPGPPAGAAAVTDAG